MEKILDLDRFPLHDLESPRGRALLDAAQRDLAERGLFNLEEFFRPEALAKAVTEIAPKFETEAFTHARRHNIYFLPEVEGLDRNHPALMEFETVNHTLCGDQIAGGLVDRVYEWPPLADFLARVMGKRELHTMADPLARVNVMAYRDGEALNWHFDRSEFTTTLLLQAPKEGGVFQYKEGLRSDGNPNYEGVGRFLSGADPQVSELPLSPGTLNIFKGKNTAHRVSKVKGERARMVAVFSYYERAGVRFSADEQRGFYGRVA